jgi:hypothetical protein
MSAEKSPPHMIRTTPVAATTAWRSVRSVTERKRSACALCNENQCLSTEIFVAGFEEKLSPGGSSSFYLIVPRVRIETTWRLTGDTLQICEAR